MFKSPPLTFTSYLPDHLPAVRGLLADAARLHLHLDWHDPLDWIAHHQAAVRLGWRNGEIAAVAAASPPRQGTTWLRVIALAAGASVQPTIAALWENLRPVLADAGISRAAALGIHAWLDPALENLKFRLIEDVVTLRRIGDPSEELPQPLRSDLTLRPVQALDLPAVTGVDRGAFEPLWQLDENDLRAALDRAASFTLAEHRGRAVGYELCTVYPEGAHLTRLATIPEMQGQGVGGALLQRALRQFDENGFSVMTVNTQRSNTASRRLYHRFGFEETDFSLPVWEIEL